ncbi:MAG TPA: hypothetical protein VGG33_08995 [Polyangia bacterium]
MNPEEHQSIAVSPRHTVVLASELMVLVARPPRNDFVLRTLARREANGLPLMTAELVIASEATRKAHPAADTYPLHFRKTYFPGRLHRDPREEYEHHLMASKLANIPAPIGHEPTVFRSCLIPGQPLSRLTPFGGDPPENNIVKAQSQPLAAAAGLWRLAEESLAHMQRLHAGGLAHGDAELHNCIICPSPLESVLIDFEASILRERLSEVDWKARCDLDLVPLLREAVYLQCALGRQPGPLGELAWNQMEALFKAAAPRFRMAIETRALV